LRDFDNPLLSSDFLKIVIIYRLVYDLLLDVNYCDEGAETPESSADDLPKKTNIYALRKVTLPSLLVKIDNVPVFLT